MRDDRFDIHQWQAKFLREAEGGGGGDKKLEKLMNDANSMTMNLTAVLAQLPNYQQYIMNPDDPANEPEHNKINVATARDALYDTKQYLQSLTNILGLLENYIQKKYNFEVYSIETGPSKNGKNK